MKVYPKYKESGVSWLGDVPEHWNIVRLGSIFKERKEKVSDTEFAPLSVTKKGILPQLQNAAKSNDGDNRKKVCVGDFVINSRSDRKGSSGISPLDGSVSLINTVLYSNSLNKGFIHNFFRSYPFKEEFYRVGRGIVADLWSTKYSDMRTIMIPVPNPEEQSNIAKYLDWKTSRINKFIKAKNKLITLLKEQKQNIINKAVTKGINHNVKMKESGIDWLGEIPEHWDIRKIKQLARMSPSKTESLKYSDINSKTTFLPMEKISVNGDILCDLKLPISQIEQGFTYFRKNDVVIAKITPCFENGKGAFLDQLDTDFGFGTTELFVLRPYSNVYGKFLRFITNSKYFLDLGKQNMTGAAGQQRVQSGFIKNFELAVPPYEEQIKIIKYLEEEITTIDNTIDKAEREIALIQEYKTKLISDVVTGKNDVRDISIPNFDSEDLNLDSSIDNEIEEEIIVEEAEL